MYTKTKREGVRGMKRILGLIVLLTFASSVALAQPVVKIETIKGTIIDNACAHAQKGKNLDEFVKTHTKQCTLMPQCIESGYSIYSNSKLTRFDKESNLKIVEFLKNPESKLHVEITAHKKGDMLSLVSIRNQ
jgi:hypothetical protein